MSTYTPTEVKRLEEIYSKDPTLETVTRLSVVLNKPKKSIIAKLVKMGIYEKAGYRTKTGEKPITKLQIVRSLEEMLGASLPGLDKTPKLTLKTLHTSISTLYTMSHDNEERLELLETYKDMLKRN